MAIARSGQELNESHQGRRLLVRFTDGEEAEIVIQTVNLPNEFDSTPESWGIVYKLLSTTCQRMELVQQFYWSRLDEILEFEELEISDDSF